MRHTNKIKRFIKYLINNGFILFRLGMKTNFSQAKSWITSAINDIKIVLNSLKMQYYSLVAFRSQFAVEKLNKAILSLMGAKIEKIHTPTEILNDIINNKEILTINEKTKEILKKISKYSEFFEKQGTKTIYGTLKDGKLTLAEEIYNSFEKIKDFIINLEKLGKHYLILFKETFKITEVEFEDLKQLKEFEGELKKWI